MRSCMQNEIDCFSFIKVMKGNVKQSHEATAKTKLL